MFPAIDIRNVTSEGNNMDKMDSDENVVAEVLLEYGNAVLFTKQ